MDDPSDAQSGGVFNAPGERQVHAPGERQVHALGRDPAGETG